VKTIAVWIAKGGTGKSSTCGNIAWELRAKGRVLLVDADPQGNLSSWIHPAPFDLELADVLAGSAQLADAIRPVREGLDLLPTFAIGGGLKEWAETKLYGRPQTFGRLVRDVAALGYEYLVFDMSPGASFLERSIVAACDEALPVLRPEVFSVDGLEVFDETLREIRDDLGGRATAPRLVVNGLNRSIPTHCAYCDGLAGIGRELFVVPTSARIVSAQTERLFLAEAAPGDRPLAEYAKIAEAIA